MLAAAAPCPNKLGVGYPARRVFGGGARPQLGEIAPAAGLLGGSVGSITARSSAPVDQVAGASALATAFPHFQALTDGRQLAVAPLPSHRRTGSAETRRFAGPRRLIANLRTAGRRELDAAQLGALGTAQAGGVRPPAAGARDPYTLSRPCDLGSAKIGLAAVRSPAGCRSETVSIGRERQLAPVGSGVQRSTAREILAREGAGRAGEADGQNRVRVCWEHRAFDHGKASEAAEGPR